MIERSARYLAQRIKQTVPEHPVSLDVMVFSLSVLINTLSIIILSLIIAVYMHDVRDALTVIVAFALLRQLSGGYHLKSGALCVVVSVAGVTALSAADFSHAMALAFTGVSICLAIVFAPSRIENQTRIPPKFFRHLKVVSVCLIAFNLFLGSSVIAATFLVQSLTLIRGRR